MRAGEAAALVERLTAARLTIATAESCTGGLLAGAITAIPGSSECFGYGLVTYSNQAKERLLGVDWEILRNHGAVSEETARAMVRGLLAVSGADIALATTGVAGPGGGSEAKPVGLVYVAAGRGERMIVQRCRFSGNRQAVREQSVEQALGVALSLTEDENER